MNLLLIGYRGTGKTTVAKLLAERLGWNWLDADAELERRSRQTIAQLFQQYGEPHFRDLESNVLKDLVNRDSWVLALGGGVVGREENRRRLKAAGTVIWLQADPETIFQRITADATTAQRRPALSVGGLDEVRELLAARTPLYAQCADLIIDTTGKLPDEVAEQISRELPWLQPGRPQP
jgi:shikimate kinase